VSLDENPPLVTHSVADEVLITFAIGAEASGVAAAAPSS
jgi:hypothetical protein